MLAAIDVGTNTVRVLIGSVRNGSVVPHRYGRKVTRLGGGFQQERGLSSESMERTLFALVGFAADISATEARLVRIVGTDVLRRSVNRSAFLDMVRDRAGLKVEVVSGEEEARLTALGVLSVLPRGLAPVLIFDIGGGSTEFVLVREGRIVWAASYPLGVVRLVEEVGDAAGSYVAGCLASARRALLAAGVLDEEDVTRLQLVGTAGTVTTLAAVKLGLRKYDWRKINNQRLDRKDLHRLAALLEPLTAEERLAVPGMENGREDLILPGLTIVDKILETFSLNSFCVSDFGLLEGVLLDASNRDG